MLWVVFVVAAVAAVLSSIAVVVSRNAVHAALNLVGTLFSVAVLFVLQEAHFLAAVQVIVYAGAVVVLFLFVIMLLGVDQHETLEEALPFQRPIAIGAGVLALYGLSLLVYSTVATGGRSARGPALSGEGGGNVERVANSLFTDFIWPFEITSVLLVIAVVGAVILVRETRGGPLPDDEPVSGSPTTSETETIA